jgi:hypothetical protein
MTVKAMSEAHEGCRGRFANLGALKVVELELLHDIVPDDIGCCEEPATAARLLVGNGPSLELDLGVENMRDGNLGFTGSQGSLYVAVGQDGTGELYLWVGSCRRFPGVNVGELDSAVAGLGNRRRYHVSAPDVMREGLLINGLASTVGWFGGLGSDFGTGGAHGERESCRDSTGSDAFIYIHPRHIGTAGEHATRTTVADTVSSGCRGSVH